MSDVPESERGAFTRDEIMRAVNAGADLVLETMADAGFSNLSSDDAYNVSNLVVCAIGSVLDNPDVSIVGVLADNFGDTANQWRSELGDEIVDQALAQNAALDEEVTRRVRQMSEAEDG